MRCGGRSCRSTAVAAAASGGATTAPSAIAGAHGMAGINVRATTATAMVVRPTATTTRPVTGAQLSLRSRGEASYAASSRIGRDEERQGELGQHGERRRARHEREHGAAERQKHGIGRTDAPRHRGQDSGGEDQSDENFELSHEHARCRGF